MNIKFLCIFILSLFINHEDAKIGRMIVGKPAKPGQFPYHVYLFLPFEVVNLTGELYGGTLIHPRWVLTAARCFEHTIALTLKNISSYQFVSMGALRMIGPQYKLNSMKKIIIHPNYEIDSNVFEEGAKNDIALIQLSKKYKLTKNVNVVMMPWQSRSIKSRCKIGYILGTGVKVWKSPSDLKVLRFGRANMTYMPPKDVTKPSPTYFYSKHVMNTHNSFLGDFGSAFVRYPIPETKIAVQHGVISGIVIDTKKKTVVIAYENVEDHMEFIFQNIPLLKCYKNLVSAIPRKKLEINARAGGSAFNYSHVIIVQAFVVVLSIWLK